MPDIRYDAHPSLLRSHPFGTLFNLLLILGGGLVAAFGEQVGQQMTVLLPPFIWTRIDMQLLHWISLGVSGLALLQLLGWWIAGLTDHLRISGDEILWTHGLLNKQYTEININSVRTLRVQQTLLQRLLNAGDVSLYTTGDAPELVVRGLPDPGRIRELIRFQSNSGAGA